MQDTPGWEAVRTSFEGDQLRIARELRMMTQAGLAAAVSASGVSSGLTGAAVSQFELGDAVPSADTLGALAAALEIDPEFLSSDASDDQVHLPAYFRSLRSAPSRDRKRARNLTQLVHRLAVVLHGHVGLPARDVPAIPADPFEEALERRVQAEAAATAVRKAWRLPRGPLDHVAEVIESHGIVCTRLPMRQDRIDAFSVNFADHPVAVLTTGKGKWDRSRFDAAHELGHIVMHDEAAGVPEAERQANEFAAAFLMPARDIKKALPDRADWRLLMELKAEWGASIASLLMRARTLEVMAEGTYVSAAKTMSARGWRRHEPVDGELEHPQVLHDALRRARRQGFSAEKLRTEGAIPADIFYDLCAVIGGD